MKRKLKWFAVVLAVLLLGLGVALFLSSRDRVTAESWKQIRAGMTKKQIEGILGGPGVNIDEFREFERVAASTQAAGTQAADEFLL